MKNRMNFKDGKGYKILLVISGAILLLLCLYFFTGIQELIKNSKDVSKNIFPRTVTEGLGVNTHFIGRQMDTDMIRDAGIKIVRTDLFWSEIEKAKGIYDFKNSGYDTLTDELIRANIRPYYVLDYSNLFYEKNGASIVTEKGRKAFNRYVNEATRRYRNKQIIWEVWNEPNTNSWVPKPNLEEYFLLLKQTAKTIKENDPSGVVVAPALAGITNESLGWLEGIFKKGALDYVDAISVHPYRGAAPESVTADYHSLRALIKKYTSKQIPIISGEWGYSTANEWYGEHFNEEQQAAYLVRMFLVNKLNHIPISIWYDWKNDGSDPNNGEQNFGLRQENIDVPKQAYYAMNTFTYLLTGYELSGRMDSGNPDDYIVKFTNKEKKTVMVLWTVGTQHEIRFPVENAKGQVMSMLGQKQEYYDSSKNRSISISNNPIYLLME